MSAETEATPEASSARRGRRGGGGAEGRRAARLGGSIKSFGYINAKSRCTKYWVKKACL